MSLFKTREWWTTTVGDGEEFDTGCLCAANIDNSANGTEKLIVGSFHGYVRVYNPTPEKLESGGWSGYKASDVMCELYVGLPVIQVQAARFVSGSQSIHLAVLSPRRIGVYTLVSQTGRAEHGNQYELRLAYEHKLQRTACNFCHGPFGAVQGRDFMLVQSMDGTVSVFEQESFAFSRFLPNALIPGPIRYLARTDSFITVSSCRMVEAYKYQILATATDAKTKQESQNLKSGKKVAADWTYNIGEQALDIQVFVNHAGITSLHVLGERSMYILTEGGKLKNMKKFDYNPSAFVPYISCNSESVNTLVCTHTNTVMVYQDVTLRWAAHMPYIPAQVAVANMSDLKGVVVTLSDNGHLTCSYLGTDPSMFTPPTSEVRELDYAQLDQEMKYLQKEIKQHQGKNSINLPTSKDEDDLEILIKVPSKLDETPQMEDIECQDEDPVPSISVKLLLKAKTHINDIKLSISVKKPLVASETFTTYHSLAPQHPGETTIKFYQKYNMLAADLKGDVTASYISPSGAPRVLSTVIKLPLKLVCKPSTPVRSAMYKITVDTNKPPVNLNDVFSDVRAEETSGGNAAGFKYYGRDSVITVLASKTSQRYRLQSDVFEDLWLILDEFTRRLHAYHVTRGVSDFKVSYDGALPLQEYFQVLDKHFECRVHDEKFRHMLEERAIQFRAIQRRLLTRFKDKTPSPLSNLDTLLDGTYRQLLALAEHTEENLIQQEKCACNLSAATQMLNYLIRVWQDLNNTEFSILQHALTPDVSDNGQYGWEEMVDAAITNLLRSCLAKSTKDHTVNPSALSMLTDTQKLKKHIALVCDRLSKGARLHIDGYQAIAETIHSQKQLDSSYSRPPQASTSKTGPNIMDLNHTYEGGGEEGSNDSQPLSSKLPPLSDIGVINTQQNKFMKKKPSQLVPDLDDMTASGKQELIYDMAQLGLED